MSDDSDLHKLLEASEDQLFRQIVTRMEGIEGLEESKRPGPEPSPEALARFEAELDKLTVRPRKRYRRLFRVAILAAILIAILLFGANAWRVYNWAGERYEKYTQIQLGDTPAATVSSWTHTYIPGYVPEGYTISDCFEGTNLKSIEYSNQDKCRFRFYQYDESVIQIDTESANSTIERAVNGRTAYLFRKDDLSTIYWNIGGYDFSIEYNPTLIPEEEVLEVAKGVQWRE